jgi:hypothetical protein
VLLFSRLFDEYVKKKHYDYYKQGDFFTAERRNNILGSAKKVLATLNVQNFLKCTKLDNISKNTMQTKCFQ